MLDELDYRSMRVLPIAVLLELLIIPLFNIYMLVEMSDSTVNEVIGATLNGGISAVYYIFESMSIVVTIVVLVCLYRINDISSSFNNTWIMFVLVIISELLRQMMGMFTGLYDDLLAVDIVTSVFHMFPKLFIMIGVAFLLRGLVGLCHEMSEANVGEIGANVKPDETEDNTGIDERVGKGVTSGEKDSNVKRIRDIKKLNKTWIGTETVRIALWFSLYVIMHIIALSGDAGTGALNLVLKLVVGLSMIMIILHIIIGILISVSTWRVFGNYYVYRYNRGK